MKPVTLKRSQWHVIKEQIKKDHTPSVWMVRSKMRSVLGFTNRFYYDETAAEQRICLDFFDDAKRTFFLLKYGDHLN